MTVWRDEDLAAAHEGVYKQLFAGTTTERVSATTGNGSCQGYATGPAWEKPSVDELKKLLADMKPAINLGRAYLVVPPQMTFPDLKFVPFEEEQTKSRVWRHSWGDYKFGIPIVRSPILYWGVDWAKPDVKEEPVLPRLMAEHVEPEQPQDLTAWQALIFVVGVGTILCLLGGVL